MSPVRSRSALKTPGAAGGVQCTRGLILPGAAAPFGPLSIGWAHSYWVDGPKFVALGLANGATVATWPDESASTDLTQATAGNKPTLVTADATFGKNVVRFDGTDDFMAGNPADLAQPNEIVIIGRLRSGGTNLWTLLDSAATNPPRNNIQHAQFSRNWAAGAGTTRESATPGNNTKFLVRLVLDNTVSTLLVNESAVLAPQSMGTDAFATITLGGRDSGAACGAWDIVFFGVSDSLLTATQRTNLKAWSTSYYGTP